ncbi:hypothetical protein DPMN_013559 [Dreissena polymorpha]|uniref:Uncharacterized protein n=1 Tax=Dreissena polymorpha TaxID=45954 RepID=A0A9D4S4F4_DREPO|nr:hypothetical protein DPMN_013559 [Dreissena polymorpha]
MVCLNNHLLIIPLNVRVQFGKQIVVAKPVHVDVVYVVAVRSEPDLVAVKLQIGAKMFLQSLHADDTK